MSAIDEARYCGRCHKYVGYHPLGGCTCREPLPQPLLSKQDLILKAAEANSRAEQAETQLAKLRDEVRETVESTVDSDGTGLRHWLATDRLSSAEIAGELLALRLAALADQETQERGGVK